MKRSKLSGDQIVYGLRFDESGKPVVGVYRQIGGSVLTYFTKRTLADPGVTELKRWKTLEV